MHANTLRGKRRRSSDGGTDRAVAAAVLLAVTTVLLLIGFAGSSVYFVLPGPMGWLYIGVVIIAAAATFVWIFSLDDKRKRGNASDLKMSKPRSKRNPLR
jgi:MFS superfamily sulfate permease-like transporter